MDVARAKIKPRFHVLVADDRERCNDFEDTALITALRECSRESIATLSRRRTNRIARAPIVNHDLSADDPSEGIK